MYQKKKKRKKGFLQCERQGLLSWQPGLQLGGQVWITNRAICSELLQPVAAASTLQPRWPRLSTEISWWGGQSGGGQVDTWSRVKWQRVQKVKVHEV